MQYSMKYTQNHTSLASEYTSDLNTVDFKVLGHHQEHIFRRHILDVADLKRRLTACPGLQEHVIHEANYQQCWRLCASVRNENSCWVTPGTFASIKWTAFNLLTLLDSYLMCQFDYYTRIIVYFVFVTKLTLLYMIKIVASFYEVQYKRIKQGVVGCACCVCFKFPRMISDLTWVIRNIKGAVFFWDSVAVPV